jgi:hypothetical protein
MSSVVIYTGPPRVDLGLTRTWMQFVSRDQIPEQIKQAMQNNSAFANYFEDLSKFRLKPPPGSHAFAQAKVAQAPPARRTLIHPPIRRRFR